MGIFFDLFDTDKQHICSEQRNIRQGLFPEDDGTNLDCYHRYFPVPHPVCNFHWISALLLASRSGGDAHYYGFYPALDLATDGDPGTWDGNFGFFFGYEISRSNLCYDFCCSNLDVLDPNSLSSDTGTRTLSKILRA